MTTYSIEDIRYNLQENISLLESAVQANDLAFADRRFDFVIHNLKRIMEEVLLLECDLNTFIDRATLDERMSKLREREDAARKAQGELVERRQARKETRIDVEGLVRHIPYIQEALRLVSWEGKRAFLRAMDLHVTVYTDRLVGTLKGGTWPGFEVPVHLVRKPRPRRQPA